MASQAELLYKIKVDAAQAVRDMEAVAGKVRGVNEEAANSSKGFAKMQMGVQNASYQLTDFVVQVQGGQNAMRALGQQAPQLLAGFGAAGAVAGVFIALLPAVINGINSMSNASARAASSLKEWTDEVEALGKMGKDIESFAKSITGTAADGFKSYVEEYNKASKTQRAEMEAWLKLKLEVEKAKLNDITSEQQGRNIDWGTANGGLSSGTENYKPNAEKMVELGSQYRIQADNVKRLTAAVNGDFKTAMAGAKLSKEGQKILDDYAKSMAGLKAKNDELVLSSQNLTQSQDDYLAVFNKVTESEKAKLKLDQEIEAHVNKFSKSQQEALYAQLNQNIALEKSNVLKAEAYKIIVESETPLDAYARRMAHINYIQQEGATSQEQINQAISKAKDTLANSTPLISGFGNAMSTAFNSMTLAGNSLSETFGNLVKDLAKVAYQVMVTEPLVRSLKQAMAGMPFFAGNKFSGGADGYTLPNGESTPSANGNVFSGSINSGSSNVIPFAIGGVVSRPTYFPMGRGKTGLAGEAGSEAIIPLRRNADGKLGVSASGMGGGGTVVNIYNQGNDKVETKTRQDSNGMDVIDVYIKKAVAEGIANGQFDKAMGSTYGLKRTGTR